ncbi:AAA-like domain-containing protein [bacterium]|nr:AAA-like domain-containing protein [bacterium]
MKKFFNTAGPVNQEAHYKIDPLQRWDSEEIFNLIEQRKYFILHAPRQTGKTSSLLALQKYLNKEGKYNCIYANFEVAQFARNDADRGVLAIINEVSGRTADLFGTRLAINEFKNEITANFSAGTALETLLKFISQNSKKPIVLLIDEIDSLVGDTLISVLRQIRAGYDKRPASFPQTIVLCGVRDIKDYRIHQGNNDIITGGSAFNIKAKSLRLGNFSKEDIVKLYNEHTDYTGQKFDDKCFDLAWKYTAGQPWLVNALGYEVTYEMKENRDRSVVITAEAFEEAKNRLVVSRATHLDQLADKLDEPRVRRVLLPMVLNGDAQSNKDDVQYCIDLGLITRGEQGLVISNDIYMEIIPRELTETRQDDFLVRFAPDWVNDDGTINSEVLLSMFQQFWRENSEIWASHIQGYEEAAPHLVFQAYLQRVANGKGIILREFGLGRRRTDLMLKWKNNAGVEQRIVIELKVLKQKDRYESIKQKALEQTADYADKLGATESHILVFDRDEKMGWRDKVFLDSGEYNGIKMKIWGM